MVKLLNTTGHKTLKFLLFGMSVLVVGQWVFANKAFAAACPAANPSASCGLSDCTNFSNFWDFESSCDVTYASIASKGPIDKVGGVTGGFLTWDNTYNTANVNDWSTWVPGKRGNALTFNGSSQFIGFLENNYQTIDRTLDLAYGNFSISVWVKTNAQAAQTIVDKIKRCGTGSFGNYDLGFSLSLVQSGANWVPRGTLIWENVGSPTTVTGDRENINYADGNWHHFVWTALDGGLQTLYADGIQVGQSFATALDMNNTQNLYIGRAHTETPTCAGHAYSTAANYFNGAMDELTFWKRALTSSEVVDLYAVATCTGGGRVCNQFGGACTFSPISCTCPSGFNWSGGCLDNNECTLGTATCGAGSSCTNRPGSYTCACNAGYLGDATGRNCNDINECTPNGGKGDCAQACTNTPGSRSCSCSAGYALNADGKSCDDINECAPNGGKGDCAQVCTNAPDGSYTCSCGAGYTLNADGKGCTEDLGIQINEWAVGRWMNDNGRLNVSARKTGNGTMDYLFIDRNGLCDLDSGWPGTAYTPGDPISINSSLNNQRACFRLVGASNTLYQASGIITVDDIPPVITFTDDAQNHWVDRETIKVTVTDVGSGVNGDNISWRFVASPEECSYVDNSNNVYDAYDSGGIIVNSQTTRNTSYICISASDAVDNGSSRVTAKLHVMNSECGNGVVETEGSETCDDGNILSNDGCSSNCRTTETGWSCLTAGEACVWVDSCQTANGGCDANANCTSTGPGTNTCACKAKFVGNGQTCALDDDNDGMPDATDNCPTVANADQADGDSNSIGDACQIDFDKIIDAVSIYRTSAGVSSDPVKMKLYDIYSTTAGDQGSDGVINFDDIIALVSTYRNYAR